jgi:hypothetical protein
LISLNIKEILDFVIWQSSEIYCVDSWCPPKAYFLRFEWAAALWMHCKYCHLSIILILLSQRICPLWTRNKRTQA